jgi:hypothetical protein
MRSLFLFSNRSIAAKIYGFSVQKGVDSISDASNDFASPIPDTHKLLNQAFWGTLSHSEGPTVFVPSPLGTLLVVEEENLTESYRGSLSNSL